MPPEGRNFRKIGDHLRGLGLRGIRLLTNNPLKIADIESAGVEVTAIPLRVARANAYVSQLYATRDWRVWPQSLIGVSVAILLTKSTARERYRDPHMGALRPGSSAIRKLGSENGASGIWVRLPITPHKLRNVYHNSPVRMILHSEKVESLFPEMLIPPLDDNRPPTRTGPRGIDPPDGAASFSEQRVIGSSTPLAATSRLGGSNPFVPVMPGFRKRDLPLEILENLPRTPVSEWRVNRSGMFKAVPHAFVLY